MSKTASSLYIYECENPTCKLRFPGEAGILSNTRCPHCRGNIQQVTAIRIDGAKYQPMDRVNHPKIEVLLDNIRSAWNVGSILRTCDGIGIEKVYCCGITPTPENKKVTKTALGAENSLQWEYHTNAVHLVKKLQPQGRLIWALEDQPGADSIYHERAYPVATPLVLVVGNEISGVDPGLLELADAVLSIPMAGMKRSYNVAIAFSIAATFLFYRQSFSQGSVSILPKT